MRYTKNRSKKDCGLAAIANLFKHFGQPLSYRNAKPFLVKFFDFKESEGMYAAHFDYMFKHANLPFKKVKKIKNASEKTIRNSVTPDQILLLGFYSPSYTHIGLIIGVGLDYVEFVNYGASGSAVKRLKMDKFMKIAKKNVCWVIQRK